MPSDQREIAAVAAPAVIKKIRTATKDNPERYSQLLPPQYRKWRLSNPKFLLKKLVRMTTPQFSSQ